MNGPPDRCAALHPNSTEPPPHHTWTPDSAALLMLIEERGRQGLYRLGLNDPLPVQLASGGAVGGFAVSQNGTRIAFDRASLSQPPALFAIAADGSAERAVDTLNRALLGRVALGNTREFTVKGWGGESVQIWVTY